MTLVLSKRLHARFLTSFLSPSSPKLVRVVERDDGRSIRPVSQADRRARSPRVRTPERARFLSCETSGLHNKHSDDLRFSRSLSGQKKKKTCADCVGTSRICCSEAKTRSWRRKTKWRANNSRPFPDVDTGGSRSADFAPLP